jgi:hypothetical protein
MQQMHHGQGGWTNGWNPSDQPGAQGYAPNASSVDELVSGAARGGDDIDEIIRMAEAGIRPPKKVDSQAVPASAAQAQVPSAASEAPPAADATEKKPKKDKDKNVKMFYSDNEVSPEEKMARMPRYAFVPDGKDDTALVDAAQPAVAGTVDE